MEIDDRIKDHVTECLQVGHLVETVMADLQVIE